MDKKIALGIAGGVGVLVVAGIAVGALLMKAPAGNPSLAVEKAFKSLMDQSSADIKGQISIASEETNLQVDLALRGVPLPGKKDGAGNMDGSVSIAGKMDGEDAEVSFDLRSIPPKTFVNLHALSIPAASLGLPLDGLLNRWVYFEASASGEASPVSDLMKDLTPGLPSDCSPTEEQKAASEAYLKSLTLADFATVSHVRAGSAADEKTAVYAVVPNKDSVKQVTARMEALTGCDVAEGEEESEMEVKKLEVAVGDRTGLVRHIQFDLSGSSKGKPGTFSGGLAFDNYNKPPTVEAPADAISFEEAMQEMMNLMFGDLFGTMPTELPDSGFDALSDEDLNLIFEEVGMDANLP